MFDVVFLCDTTILGSVWVGSFLFGASQKKLNLRPSTPRLDFLNKFLFESRLKLVPPPQILTPDNKFLQKTLLWLSYLHIPDHWHHHHINVNIIIKEPIISSSKHALSIFLSLSWCRERVAHVSASGGDYGKHLTENLDSLHIDNIKYGVWMWENHIRWRQT